MKLVQAISKREAISEKIKALGTSGKNAWEEMKSGIDEAMQDLSRAFKKAAAEFSKT